VSDKRLVWFGLLNILNKTVEVVTGHKGESDSWLLWSVCSLHIR